MSLKNTYFESNKEYTPLPVPEQPGYVPPIVPTPPVPGEGSTPTIDRPIFSGDTTITFYRNSSESIVVNKNISLLRYADISIKDTVDLLHPIILLNGDYSDVNYAYMLGRYYYVAPSIRRAGMTELHMSYDCLMTYKEEILQHSAVIERNENVYNKYLNDKSFKTYAYKHTRTLEFPSGFSNNLQWILVTLGGQSTGSQGGE